MSVTALLTHVVPQFERQVQWLTLLVWCCDSAHSLRDISSEQESIWKTTRIIIVISAICCILRCFNLAILRIRRSGSTNEERRMDNCIAEPRPHSYLRQGNILRICSCLWATSCFSGAIDLPGGHVPQNHNVTTGYEPIGGPFDLPTQKK